MRVLPMASGRDLRTPGRIVTAAAAAWCDVPIVHANQPETNDRAEVDRAGGALPGHRYELHGLGHFANHGVLSRECLDPTELMESGRPDLCGVKAKATTQGSSGSVSVRENSLRTRHSHGVIYGTPLLL